MNMEKVLLSFLIGSAVISWISFIFILLNLDLSLVIFICLSIFIIILLSGLRKMHISISLLKFSLFIFIIWIISDIYMRSYMISDGLYLWGFKARVLFEKTDIIKNYFQNSALIWSHIDYPLYLSVLETLIYKFFGSLWEPLAFFVVPTFYLFSGFFIFITLRRFLNFSLSFLLLILYFFIPHMRNIAVLNYADIPLALFYMIAIVYFFLYLRSNKSLYKYLSFFAAANLFWVKKEGIILFIIYLVGFFIFRGNYKKNKNDYFLFLVLSLPSLLWYFFLFINKVPSIDFVTPSYNYLVANMNRFFELPVYMRRLLKFSPHWGYFWPVLFVLMIIKYRFLKERSNQYFVYSVVLPLIIYPFIFVFSTWQPYYEHVRTALDRLILQVFPTAFILFAIIAAENCRIKKDTQI